MKLTCPKCHGSGQTEFSHIASGKCFPCDGSGEIPFSEDYDILLDDFMRSGTPAITTGIRCRVKVGSLTIPEGGEYIAKTVDENVIIWDAAHEADWYLEIPRICESLLIKHFERI